MTTINNTTITCYGADGTLNNIETKEFNEQGQEVRMERVSENGGTDVEVYEYNSDGRLAKATQTTTYEQDGDNSTTNSFYSLYSYDDVSRTRTEDEYDEENKLGVILIVAMLEHLKIVRVSCRN